MKNKKIVELKDGTLGILIKEWNWREQPNNKIYKTENLEERIYENFYDVLLPSILCPFASPKNSMFARQTITVLKRDCKIKNQNK